MTVEPSYLIPPHVIHTHEGDHPMQAAMCLRCMLDLHIADGELVPDTRLQAIADAWNEGNIEPMSDGIRVAHKSVQDWWPELATLLGALAEEAVNVQAD